MYNIQVFFTSSQCDKAYFLDNLKEKMDTQVK